MSQKGDVTYICNHPKHSFFTKNFETCRVDTMISNKSLRNVEWFDATLFVFLLTLFQSLLYGFVVTMMHMHFIICMKSIILIATYRRCQGKRANLKNVISWCPRIVPLILILVINIFLFFVSFYFFFFSFWVLWRHKIKWNWKKFEANCHDFSEGPTTGPATRTPFLWKFYKLLSSISNQLTSNKLGV